ncbi:predicted protein [Sclerotinia sclerotiorum 1980 UF-70]|uniref:Uncharacterized protein n=2 Tax=Sclerotinia sclerotiorum (strain ATCC 18683 / 1980 / Ss-1) TaxID=665079 RepID=A7EDD3_SCLS1|nr:predicted protein [Sclerotinia sclerotiorum 1980 UF-70]APA10979.1 hypothetical protein sscle_07g057490 [Sclerotinia sclerotiorum 1980 UF-70]EDO00849.1 predicted protein [Sclerotinia sclerotiorum 1980 UF-70]
MISKSILSPTARSTLTKNVRSAFDCGILSIWVACRDPQFIYHEAFWENGIGHRVYGLSFPSKEDVLALVRSTVGLLTNIDICSWRDTVGAGVTPVQAYLPLEELEVTLD